MLIQLKKLLVNCRLQIPGQQLQDVTPTVPHPDILTPSTYAGNEHGDP